jgi:flagellar basal body-associated protein FliL
MKRSTIILILLLVLAILAFSRTGVWRVPGQTTQAEQRRIKGMSVIVEDL